MKFVVIQETKNRWERRTPLIPGDVATLCGEHDLDISVVSTELRIFPDAAYAEAGAAVVASAAVGDVVLGIKEPPLEEIRDDQLFVVFSHTIKGQAYNMPLLRRFLDHGCSLIDYERIVDDQGRRLIAFGRFAGIAGAIDTVWSLARRLDALGVEEHPLTDACPTHEYATTERAWEAMEAIGARIREQGFPVGMAPVVIGVVGCGNVGQGAGEVLDHLGAVQVTPAELASLPAKANTLYRVDLVEHDLYARDDGGEFVLQRYYDHPEEFHCVAEPFLGHITALVNTAYWDGRYPRTVSNDALRRYADSRDRMLVIGDVACDVEGAIEATVRCTDLDEPTFVFDPDSGASPDGFAGRGAVVMSVDNLPCELSAEASGFFSRILRTFLPQLSRADLTAPLTEAGLPPELERAVIVWRGQLTPDYAHLEQNLRDAGLGS
jgi:saccharopine dehydrogenase (NAD+, L-lysine forming)